MDEYRSLRMNSLAVAALTVLLLAFVSPASAKDCGKDAAPNPADPDKRIDVPCACGDIVVGDFKLSADIRNCQKSPALTVVARFDPAKGTAVQAELDLGGQTVDSGLVPGTGSVGVSVKGGKVANGFVTRFDIGVQTTGVNTFFGTVMGLVEKVTAHRNGVGILVTNANRVIKNGVYKSDRDGIQVEGDGNTLEDNVVGTIDKDINFGNMQRGIFIQGKSNQLLDNRVFANGCTGIEVTGGTRRDPNRLKDNIVGKSVDKGPRAGNGHTDPRCAARFGIYIHDDLGAGNDPKKDIELENNTVQSNREDGIHLGPNAGGHRLKDNTSGGGRRIESNGTCAYVFTGAGNIDSGNNKGNDEAVTGNPQTNLFPPGKFPSVVIRAQQVCTLPKN